MLRDDRYEDKAPYSRLFIVCSKHLTKDDLRPVFEKYGEIEDLHMPKDRSTGESKGIAYIKYRKTSSAAAAITELNMTHILNSDKPIKVMVATNKNDEKNDNESKYKRLFIKVPKDLTENEIKDHFSKFGHVESVRLQKNKETRESRGFAYVCYNSFLHAAKAFEQCDQSYKAIFAIPKEDLKRGRNDYDNFDKFPSNDSLYMREYPPDMHRDLSLYRDHNSFRDNNQRDVTRRDCILPLIKTEPKDFDKIVVMCRPLVPQKPLEKLLRIIPGMMQFHYSSDSYNGVCKAIVKYETKVAAAYAIETLNNYEFPSGELLSVKPDDNPIGKVANNLTDMVNNFKNSLNSNTDLMQLADAIAQASSLIMAATSNTEMQVEANESPKYNCSIKLPPIRPMASAGSTVAQRCFIVFKPQQLPPKILHDLFCRFGDLIDVNAMPNKTFGFARYASSAAARNAINTLNDAVVLGVRLKVIEASEKTNKHKTQFDSENESNDDDIHKKRLKLQRDDYMEE